MRLTPASGSLYIHDHINAFSSTSILLSKKLFKKLFISDGFCDNNVIVTSLITSPLKYNYTAIFKRFIVVNIGKEFA